VAHGISLSPHEPRWNDAKPLQPGDTVRAMRRQCARPGCSAVATTTFTFDSTRCTVWLDALSDVGARAGDLCDRHSRHLAPPQGWRLEDRRTPAVALAPAATAARPPTGWEPRFDPADDLDGLLDARSPLLGRAFGNVRAR
jgi:hypothetical protein